MERTGDFGQFIVKGRSFVFFQAFFFQDQSTARGQQCCKKMEGVIVRAVIFHLSSGGVEFHTWRNILYFFVVGSKDDVYGWVEVCEILKLI